eukprot:CAMPEP_0168559500 /NCGR_PEP_ID=MMETSP0413-20121227/10558_1 /TAXON_ID=136452 /ORGANISM="Filamoeba nolandi, Strain NC-AS-23-1" /LENGTH=959 /DNA_ID=CAMNT_0008590735 /DNA_START=92 /DNA_END=2971 /DNA_ORIENTATION=-
MMDLISLARDVTPVLADKPTEQDRIINACKEAAKTVIAFKDLIKANSTDIPAFLEAVVSIENSSTHVLDSIKATSVPQLDPNSLDDTEDAVSRVFSCTSLFRIFLGKLRVTSGLKVISSVADDSRGGSPNPSPRSSMNELISPNGSTGNLRSAMIDDVIFSLRPPQPDLQEEIQALQDRLAQLQPTDSKVAKQQLQQLMESNSPHAWIVEKLILELKSRIQNERAAESLATQLNNEAYSFRQWKEQAVTSFKQTINDKDQQIMLYKAELEKLQSAQSSDINNKQQQLEKDKSYLMNLTMLEQQLEEKNRQMVPLYAKIRELEQKYRNTKDALNKYIIEVEDWKRESMERFHEQLAAKDKEINELKETVEFAMAKEPAARKSIAADKDDDNEIVNELLDFISTKKTTTSPSTTPAIAVTPAKSNNNSPATLTPSSSSEEKQPLQKANSGQWKSVSPTVPPKRVFKVLLPNNRGTFTTEYKENMTLGALLDLIKEKESLPDVDSYRFQFVDSAANAPYVKLSAPLKTLGVSIVRLVKTEPNIPTKIDRGEGVSQPYNVFHLEHKSVEDLIHMMEKTLDEDKPPAIVPTSKSLVSLCPGFDIEVGDPKASRLEDVQVRKLIDSDKNTPYYQHYFLNRAHVNYFSDPLTRIGPVIVSLELLEKTQREMFSADQTIKLRALVRTKYDDEWVFLPATIKSKHRSLAKAIEADCRHGDKLAGIKLRKIKHGDGPKELSQMEAKLMAKGYKFGVLYCKASQTDEDGMFGNVETSADYEEFLSWLGEKIVLKGWEGYRGGLDVKNNSTGTHSVFTRHCGYEIMFHVSTLLPFYPNDKQQLERKRHLGNDVCVIIFKDSDEPFAPNTIKSEFNHVFAVVCKDKKLSVDGKTFYQVTFAYKDAIGMTYPPLPFPAVFENTQIFRDFLLTKLINSERSAMYAPSFINKLAKTKELQMMDVIERLKQLEKDG